MPDHSARPEPIPTPPRPLRDVAALFLRLGATAFGGPAASIAMMRDEVVRRRGWLSGPQFLDLLGASNLSPGPTATKLAMYIGQRRAGWIGLVVAGVGFVLPATLIVLGLAWAYVEYGSTPAAGWLLYGIKPVIIPLILAALGQLGRHAIKNVTAGLVWIAVALLYLAGANPLLLMVGSGVITMLAHNATHLRQVDLSRLIFPLPIGLAATGAAAGFSLTRLFLLFLKVGAVMYGSGYVLLAFLHTDLVEQRGWLTEAQLIDAVAIGQMTPGPLSTTATFIGYMLGGVPGALLATAGIYLPAFLITGLSFPLIPHLRGSSWASSLLDGLNVAALGLMASVTWNLARAAYPDVFTILVGIIAAALMLRYNINSVGLVVFGAGMGLLSTVF
jgi:chromate transporter